MASFYFDNENARALFTVLTLFLCTTVITSGMRIAKIVLVQKDKMLIQDYFMALSVVSISCDILEVVLINM